MSKFNLEKIVRPNIWSLEPYRSARDDYTSGILLDANENSYGPALPVISDAETSLELNRYPDTHLTTVKQRICDFRNSEAVEKGLAPLTPANIFAGVGSDEAIDSIIRALCIPKKDSILICPPTYGMYDVCAVINEVGIIKVNQDVSERGHFKLQFDKIAEELTKDAAGEQNIKIVYVTNPGNPSPSLADKEGIIKLLNHPTWNGIVISDEAYIDFCPPGSSLAPLVTKYPNLMVMQTISKAFGLAGARFGIAFCSQELAKVLNAMKAPYNISTLTAGVAARAYSKEGLAHMKMMVADIVKQREFLVEELPKIDGVGDFIGGQDTNFLLVEILNNGTPDNEFTKNVYRYLANDRKVVVRFRGTEYGCTGCVRISIGTEEENKTLLKELDVAIKKAHE